MKWLVAALLLLNIAMFMWGSWYLVAPPGATVGAHPAVNADQMRPLAAPTAALLSTAKTAQGGQVCASVGPFLSPAAVAQASESLRQLGIEQQQRQQLEGTVASYRVFLPSLPSRQAAARKRVELTRLGFKEHYIIDESGRENAISLGVFALQENASTLARRLAKKGITAEQETLYNTQTIYWLGIGVTSDQLGRLARRGWPSPRARVIERQCGVAPAESVREPAEKRARSG